ncbi:MAG: hypothetical protein ACD_41C00306G0008 [uncultured bacterium]|nr:MAG: hypothetical protein ACD_41C00306G0008 [uncultured bacterium]HBY74259.1 hypothetical protein [Candidatus Kerfeldbacteria bacterium]
MDELQGQDLKMAYWYNTHRAQVRTAAYGVAIAAVALLWLIVIILFVRVLLDRSATNRAIHDLAATQVIYDSIQAPQPLTITAVDAISHTTESVDAYAIVSNPNTYYAARFTYTVTINGTAYSYTDGGVMPKSDTYIVVSGVAGSATASADLTIQETTWQRIRGPQPDATFLVNDAELATNEIPIGSTTDTTTTDSDFATPEDDEAIDDTPAPGKTISQVSGSVTNTSAYGFRQVKVTALVTTPAGTVEGVQQVILSDVASFSDSALLFSWQRRFNFNDVPKIIVETDVWDETNLIRPGDL